MSERYNRAVRAASRAWGAYVSAAATASRLAADYHVRPSEGRWHRATRAERAQRRALDRWVAASRRASDLAPRSTAPIRATVAPRVGRVAREWCGAVAAVGAGIVAALAPALAFLGSVVSADVFAAAVR